MKKELCKTSDEYLKMSGAVDIINKLNKAEYVINLLETENDHELNENEQKRLNYHKTIKTLYNSPYYAEIVNNLDSYEYLRAKTIIDNSKHRYNRLYKYISGMFEKFPKKCYFLTLTFRDEVLNKYLINEKKEINENGEFQPTNYYNMTLLNKLVKRYLYKQCCLYIANIDYGMLDEYYNRKNQKVKGTKRLHFHAVIVPRSTSIDLKYWYKNYGFFWIEKCRISETDSKKIAHYITKLTNHAFKDSVNDNKVIYSKNIKVVNYEQKGFELFSCLLD